MSLNRVILIGRLTRDPELRTTSTGKSVAGFSIAVDKRFKPTDGSPTADFFNISAWGQTAEYVTNYMSKGRLVAVDGRLQTRKYTDKNGQERDAWEIVADNVQGLDRPRDDQATGGGVRTATASQSAAPSPEEFDPFADD